MDLTGRHRSQRGISKGPGMLQVKREFILGMLLWVLEEH